MSKSFVLRFFTSFVFLLTGCSQNFIGSFVNPNSDAALYEDALIAINASKWTTAIADIQAMSPSGQSARTTMFTFATALAAIYAFSAHSLVPGFDAALGGGGAPVALMLTLMQAFQNTTVNMLVPGVVAPVNTTDTYCSWAQQEMDDIQTNYGAWNINEQTFVVLFSLAKIGMILKTTAGAGGTMSGGNLIADATFNSCLPAGALSNFYATQVATGWSLFLQYYTVIPFLAALQVAGVTLPALLCGTVASSECNEPL